MDYMFIIRGENMDKNRENLIEYIMQLKISDLIKNNRELDKNKLISGVEELLSLKDEMYEMDDDELEEKLKNKYEENNNE